ncbi:MAG: Asp23/Gls24 family envelope stress response protein [Victivallales bacterium]|nr:Asp23/Gls24 family envelope stress response protein [Victivallales bacterium]
MKAKDSRAQFDLSFENGTEKVNDKGTIKLHEGVITSVVSTAACSVKGVISLGGSSLANSIVDILGTRKRSDSAVCINLDEDKAEVELTIITEYGKNIPAIALDVQTTIIKEVKNITGLNVTKVDVTVQGIDDPKLVEEVEEQQLNENKE